jgi:hypothetical protein
LLLFASSGSIGAPIAGDEFVEHLPPPGKLKAVGQKLEHGGIAALFTGETNHVSKILGIDIDRYFHAWILDEGMSGGKRAYQMPESKCEARQHD